jgi:ATP-dependent DNA helicase RecG
MTDDQFSALLKSLASLPSETEWVEFKHNVFIPQDVGQYISAMSNSAALFQRDCGYIVWGIDDSTRELCGTNVCFHERKVGSEDVHNWLAHMLFPSIDFRVHDHIHDGKHFVIVEIPAATHTPVRFKDFEWIRVGSHTKKLRDYPEKERQLWDGFRSYIFEKEAALEDIAEPEVLSLLDSGAYYKLMETTPPDRKVTIGHLISDRLIKEKSYGNFDITNLGAILLARDIRRFERLSRKAIRVVQYRGPDRTDSIEEKPGIRGYASGFSGLVDFLNARIPRNEVIEKSLRKNVPMYPEIAVRELIVNALMHQDFKIAGSGPIIELFSNRLEFTNPGVPLIPPIRFLDEPSRVRNDMLSAMMHKLRLSEERGSGIDKVVFWAEAWQLPAPDFMATENHTRAILFACREFNKLEKPDRIRACYQHASLMKMSGAHMTNKTLRKRFGLPDQSIAIVSKIIRSTLDAGLIKEADVSSSDKFKQYVPFWVS